jgi:hypothetical protein
MVRLRERVEKDRAEQRKKSGIAQPKLLADARVHDLRKTVTTWLREEKLISSDVCDLILHHARKGVTASHYDFSTLEGPVRAALQAWADYVWTISGHWLAGSNVVQLKERASAWRPATDNTLDKIREAYTDAARTHPAEYPPLPA